MKVKPGSRWKHTNGSVYTVLHVTNEHAAEHRKSEYPTTVVYRGPDRNVWSKEVAAFLKSRTRLHSYIHAGGGEWSDTFACVSCGKRLNFDAEDAMSETALNELDKTTCQGDV